MSLELAETLILPALHIICDERIKTSMPIRQNIHECFNLSADTGFCGYCIHSKASRGAQNSSHLCMSRPFRSVLDRDQLSTQRPDALWRARLGLERTGTVRTCRDDYYSERLATSGDGYSGHESRCPPKYWIHVSNHVPRALGLTA